MAQSTKQRRAARRRRISVDNLRLLKKVGSNTNYILNSMLGPERVSTMRILFNQLYGSKSPLRS